MGADVKGALEQNPAQKHRYKMLVVGLNPAELNPTSIDGIEATTGVAELPDRTRISDGVIKAGSFTIKMPVHHVVEMAALKTWYKDTRAKAPSEYKKTVTILHLNGARAIVRTTKLGGVWPEGYSESSLEMGNEGEMGETEWTLSFDSATFD